MRQFGTSGTDGLSLKFPDEPLGITFHLGGLVEDSPDSISADHFSLFGQLVVVQHALGLHADLEALLVAAVLALPPVLRRHATHLTKSTRKLLRILHASPEKVLPNCA